MTPKLTPSQEHNQRIAREKAKSELDQFLKEHQPALKPGDQAANVLDNTAGTILTRWVHKTQEWVMDHFAPNQPIAAAMLHEKMIQAQEMTGLNALQNYPPQVVTLSQEQEIDVGQKIIEMYHALKYSQSWDSEFYRNEKENYEDSHGEGTFNIYVGASWRYTETADNHGWSRQRTRDFLKKHDPNYGKA